MQTAFRHPPSKRIAVAELMRETDLTADAIAQRVRVPYATVCRWNQFHNWRPWFRRAAPSVDPQRWSKPRLAALERVYRQPGVDPGDLAQAVGTDRIRHRAFFRNCGFAERAPRPAVEALAGEELREALRGHVARQIGEFDAWLSMPKDAAESARILRDLAGLKRLIDELDARPAPPPAAPALDAVPAGAVGASETTEDLRAAIAGRFAALADAAD